MVMHIRTVVETDAWVFVFLSISVFAAALFSSKYKGTRRQVQALPLPPGPPSDPIIGHVRFIPKKFPWLTFADWGKRWGGLIYVRILGKPMIIINDLKVAKELMEKRGSIYSDRPRFVMFNEMMGWNKLLAFLPYGEKFRRHRKMIQQHFNSQTVASFRPLQRAELYIMLENFLKSPQSYSHHIYRATAGTLTAVTYGYKVISDHDPYVETVERAGTMTIQSGAPGESIVDFLPALRHIPAWLPGAGFKRHAQKTKEVAEETLNVPYEFVKKNRAQGVALPSVISHFLDEHEEKGDVQADYEDDIKAVGGVIFQAGFETTRAVLHTFIFAMLQYPDVAKRAQAAIDRVVGPNRMPCTEDRDSLPCIDGILRETLRWCPPVPLGIPHSLMQSDTYSGMQIPKGSMVIANIWQIMHDERYFPSPETFDPDRFVNKPSKGTNEDEPDPLNVVFGFGRRVCPGRFFAEQGLWLTMASILAAFNINPPLDDEGREYMPKIAFTSGTGSQPEDFECRIIPRNDSYIKLIQQERASDR